MVSRALNDLTADTRSEIVGKGIDAEDGSGEFERTHAQREREV